MKAAIRVRTRHLHPNSVTSSTLMYGTWIYITQPLALALSPPEDINLELSEQQGETI